MVHPRRALLFAVMAAALAACSSRPFVVDPPSEAMKAVEPYLSDASERGPFDYNPDPRPIALCYSTQLNTLDEVMERARTLCPNDGRLVYFSEDSIVNGCALLQPHRVTFLCTPGPQPPSPYE